tara:strand:- start:16537 stop:17106 length:570 start_codon:yes stop_codon:yes gene_type:complete
MIQNENQHTLVSQIKENNETVLKELYQNNYYKIEAYILKNNGTKPQAKDIYQEAFLAVWQNIKKGAFTPQNEGAVQGYLYQIAKNKWTDVLRSSRYKKTQQGLTDLHLMEHEKEPDTETDENIKTVMTAFNELGEECRQLLTRFYFSKMPLSEIASHFNIGEASARNKKYRCIQKLKMLSNPQIHENKT